MRHLCISIIIFVICINSTLIYSQNTGPNVPEAMAFEPVDAADMVNFLTGDFTYVLPLMNIPGPNGGYPIVLNYHAGVVDDQEATWVGLGWNLNTGALTRTVNGNPDDLFNGRFQTIQHNDGATSTYNYLNINSPFPQVPIGIHGTWGDYKSFGGSVTFMGVLNVGLMGDEAGNVSGSLGIQVGDFSVSANVSDDAIGMTVGSGGFSANVSSNGSVGVGYGTMIGSVGISLSSEGFSSSVNFVGVSNNVSASVSSTMDISYKSWGWDVNLIFIQFGQKSQSWWLHDVGDDYLFGTLYANDAKYDSYQDGNLNWGTIQAYNHVMDVNVIADNSFSYRKDSTDKKNSFIVPGYDYYGVSGQGISGSISPRLKSKSLLTGQGRVLSNWNRDDPNNWYDVVKEEVCYMSSSRLIPSMTFDPHSVDYYFTRLNESYFETTPGIINYDPDASATSEVVWSYDFSLNGGSENAVNNLKASKPIEWFTNKQIIENISDCKLRGFIETESISNDSDFPDNPRNNSILFAYDGIGAYVITATDGKSYHYTLPVYQFEEVKQIHQDEKSYVEQRNLGMHAVAWMLTAITGPDYIDINNNGIDDADYGYWVKFNYGKWADGYIWQKPFIKENDDDPIIFGRKQIYYLNSVETASHMALFIKDVRSDGNGKDKAIELFTEAGNDVIIPKEELPEGYEEDETGVVNTNTEFVTDQVSVLKLSKILLLDKNDIPIAIETSGSPLLSEKEGKIDYSKFYSSIEYSIETKVEDAYDRWFEKWDGNPIVRDIEVSYDEARYLYEGTVYFNNIMIHYIRIFKSHYSNNILDVNDMNASNLEALSIKGIGFEYDETNPIGHGDNTNYVNKGKLTLAQVQFYGKNRVNVTPPYTFDYNRSTLSEFDEWGFQIGNPENYSLSSITTPTGGNVNITYESDTYNNESVFEKNKILEYLYDVTFVPSQKLIVIRIPNWFPINDFVEKTIELDIEYERTYYNAVSEETIGPVFESFTTNDYTVDITKRTVTYDLNLNSGWFVSNIKIDFDNTLEYVGGGLRVKEIALTDNTETYKTTYDYNSNGISSGITSFSPTKFERKIPYINLLPYPNINYKWVTVSQESASGQKLSKTKYQFETLSPNSSIEGYDLSIGNILNISNSNSNFEDKDEFWEVTSQSKVSVRNGVIEDNTAALGRLITQSVYNDFDDVLRSTEYRYEDNLSVFTQGVFQENFYSVKMYHNWDEGHGNWNSVYHYNSVNKKEYASILNEVVTTSGNLSSSIKYAYDIETGKSNEIITVNSKGDSFKSLSVPAYHVYEEMGMKSDNIENKNMLTQQAASLSYKLTGTDPEVESDWSVLGASIQTWKGDWNNYVEWDGSSNLYAYNRTDGTFEVDGTTYDNTIWRKHKTFGWKGALDSYGAYANFTSWDSPEELMGFTGFTDETYEGAAENTNGWQKTSEVVRYNHYSSPIEVKDINGDFAASKKDPDNVYTTASCANASYASFGATSFEYAKVLIPEAAANLCFDGEIVVIGSIEQFGWNKNWDQNADDQSRMINGINAHTGERYLKLSTSSPKPSYKGEQLTGKAELIINSDYRASVWVHKNSPGTMSLKAKVNGVVQTNTQQSMGIYGNWQLYYLDFSVGSTATSFESYIEASGADVYVDDFRVAPFESALTSYTYDNAGQVTAIINNDNFATKYEYDAGGRLIATYRETEYGFDLVTTNKYRYSQGFDVEQYSGLVSFAGETITINMLNTSQDVLAYQLEDWMTFVNETTNEISIQIAENPNCQDQRTGAIIVSNTTTGVDYTVSINQEGQKLELRENPGHPLPATGTVGTVVSVACYAKNIGSISQDGCVTLHLSNSPYALSSVVESEICTTLAIGEEQYISTSLTVPNVPDASNLWLYIVSCSGDVIVSSDPMVIN